MSKYKALKLKKDIVLREEADNYALLFNSDTGNSFIINPVSVFICKNLDGENSIEEIVSKIKKNFIDVSDKVKEEVQEFIMMLEKKELVE